MKADVETANLQSIVPPWLMILVLIVLAGSLIPLGIPFNAVLFVALLYALALALFVLRTRWILLAFWLILPFVDMLKRMVFLDPQATAFYMYIVLFLPDFLLLLFLVGRGLSWLAKGSTRLYLHLNRADVFLTIFAVYSLFSALFISSAPLTARISATGLWVWPVVTYFLSSQFLRRFRLSELLLIVVSLAVVVALYGIKQFFGGLTSFEQAWFYGPSNSANVSHLVHDASVGVFRTFSTLDSHSSYGVFLGIGLVLAWALHPRLGKGPWLLTSALLAFGLFLSFTRFTWLVPILSLVLITFLRFGGLWVGRHLRWAGLRRAMIMVTFVTGSYFALQLVMRKLYGISLPALLGIAGPYARRILGTSTLEARLRLPTLDNISLWGTGLANANFLSNKFGVADAGPVVNYHNIFLDMLQSLGVIGLLLFLVFLFVFFATALRNTYREKDPGRQRILIALFGLVLALVTVGHFNGAVFYFGHAIPFYFWALCGFLVHPSVEINNATPADSA